MRRKHLPFMCVWFARDRAIMVSDVVVGGTLAWAGGLKLAGTRSADAMFAFLFGVDGIHLRSSVLVVALAEFVVGALLLCGVRRQFLRWLIGAMITGYTVGLAWAFAHGFQGGCGCLGWRESVPLALLRNGVLLSLVALASALSVGFQSQVKESESCVGFNRSS